MSLEYLAGQILTADELQKSVPNRVEQGTDQDVVSSTTLVDSSLVVPVNDLIRVEVNARLTDGGGGFIWDWTETGSITVESRDILSAGSSTSGGVTNTADMRFRMVQTLGEDQDVANFSNVTSHRINEVLVVQGSGTMTFRFAQETSNANATTLMSQSHIVWQYLAE